MTNVTYCHPHVVPTSEITSGWTKFLLVFHGENVLGLLAQDFLYRPNTIPITHPTLQRHQSYASE